MATKLQDALTRLEALGNDRVRTLNIRNGAGDNQFGVKLGDIRKLADAIKTAHDLALAQVADWFNSYIVKQHPGKEAPRAKPEVQWTMNNCLAGIGIHHPKLRKRAVALGETLGLFRDYPVSKGCTSPFAPIWIAEMVRRQG